MISFSQYSYILFTGLGYHHHFGAIHIILLGHDKVNKYVTDKENNRDNNQDNNKDSTKGDLIKFERFRSLRWELEEYS